MMTKEKNAVSTPVQKINNNIHFLKNLQLSSGDNLKFLPGEGIRSTQHADRESHFKSGPPTRTCILYKISPPAMRERVQKRCFLYKVGSNLL